MLLDQVRARNAFGAVSQLPMARRSDFLQLARKLPAMFQTNGLLASWAHLLSKREKKENEYTDATGALLRHFRDDSVGLLSDRTRDAQKVLLELWTASPNTGELQRLTAEAVIFASWLKRAAEAICDTGDNPEQENRT